MRRVIIVCASLMSLVSVAALGQGPFEVPHEVKLRIVVVESLIDRAYVGEVNGLSEEFLSGMNEIAEIVGQSLEEASIRRADSVDARLIEIATDQNRRRSLYEEIRAKYIEGVVKPHAVIPAAPELDPRHVAEEYRLIWEYYLLRPPSQRQSFKADRRILDALALINNAESVTAIKRAFAATTARQVRLSRTITNKQKLLIQTLGRMPSVVSLEAMFVALDASEQQISADTFYDKTEFARPIDFDPQEYVVRALTDQDQFGTRAAWYAILSARPDGAVPFKYRSLLERVLRQR